MYDVTIGNDSASLGSERTDIMNTKGKKPKRKVKMDYGDGSIYFVKSRNCYAGQVYLEIDGEKIRKSVYGKTERIVKDKIRELQIQAKAGAFKKVDKTTFYELAEKMIEEQIDLNEIRQSTYKRKLETLKMLAPLSDKQLRKITEDDIVAYFKDNLDYAQSTLNKLYQLLGAVFKKAIKKGIIDKSPLAVFAVPNQRNVQRAVVVFGHRLYREIPRRLGRIEVVQLQWSRVLHISSVGFDRLVVLGLFVLHGSCKAERENTDFAALEISFVDD